MTKLMNLIGNFGEFLRGDSKVADVAEPTRKATGKEKREALYTLSEAAAIWDLPVKTVHKLYDTMLNNSLKARRGRKRHLRVAGLLAVGLELRLREWMTQDCRRELYQGLEGVQQDANAVLLGPSGSGIYVECGSMVEMMELRVERLRRAYAAIDWGRKGKIGWRATAVPVLRGTDVPLYVLAELTWEYTVKKFPHIVKEQWELAAFVAQARPARGRPLRDFDNVEVM